MMAVNPGLTMACRRDHARTRSRQATVRRSIRWTYTAGLECGAGRILIDRSDGRRFSRRRSRFLSRHRVVAWPSANPEIDPQIGSHLAQGWQPVAHRQHSARILRSGVYRNHRARDVPHTQPSTNMSRSRTTLWRRGPTVVNGVLDRRGAETRQGELGRKTAKKPG